MSRFETFRYTLMVVLLSFLGAFGWKLYRAVDFDRLRLALDAPPGDEHIVTGSNKSRD